MTSRSAKTTMSSVLSSCNPDFKDGTLFLKMLGRKLYEYAVTTVPSLVRESLEKAKLHLTDVHKVLMHQANARMNGMILKRMFAHDNIKEIPNGIMPMTISFLGNSSVATIPTILDLIARAGTADGLNAVDLNYPDHFADSNPAELADLAKAGGKLGTEPLAQNPKAFNHALIDFMASH